MYQDACESTCFKLGMMLNTTLQFDSGLNDCGVCSRSQGTGKLELVQVVLLHEVLKMFVMVDTASVALC